MSAAQNIANAKYFRDRGQFCRCGLLASSFLFAYHCKINKYTTPTPSCNVELEERLNAEPILPNSYIIAPTECMGAFAGRHPQQTLLEKLKSINTEIRSMQCILSPDAGFLEAVTSDKYFEERKHDDDDAEQQTEKLQQHLHSGEIDDVMHDVNLNDDDDGHADGTRQHNYGTPQLNSKDITLTPMDKSMTLTPIASHVKCAHHQKLEMVVSDLNTSRTSNNGGHFSVIGSEMSLSNTTH
eukprot:CAMPEP_0202695040 /NCGR_PEP_ID=MMETSP1385-20130828/8740_1 /ASSEMBLY_ACC=CAM_ASM_000861 /TAXON_ID=933848 /ORGANISM="Elphidium margaritaceum" /LENGTH=239 /DNA_ID=CAMNT_0049350999 /DNA_START=264 /DNA_END=983 /DNA_ORIENTATION=-